ncbi:MAG: M3 family metallopeptidase [Pseudomonadota bacterium]
MTHNPLIVPADLPFGLPDYANLSPDHFASAFDHAMAEHLAEIDQIAAATDAPTFENTLDALERSGRALSRVAMVFFNLTSADTNDALQAIERDLAPKLSAHQSKISMNHALFARIDQVFETQADLDLTTEQQRVLERTHRGFVKSGAKLEGADKERFAEIKSRLAVLGTTFSQRVLADEAKFELPLTAPDDLDGLPDFVVAAAASAAKERGSDAAHVITLSRSLIDPFLTFSTRPDLREKAFTAWTARGAGGDDNDTREIIAETLALRHEMATLLGYETYAAMKLEFAMAERPENVRDLLENVWTPARARAEAEAATLQAAARSDGSNTTIAAADWRHWAERVRRRDYALDETELKQYLALDNIIAGAFHAAGRLFGVSFKEVEGLALYHPDVRAWEVTDDAGAHVGLFIGDYFARPSKRSGAWMTALRGQRNLDERIRPIIVNVMNFARGPENEPALLSFDDARTLFHEFGHALHGLLSNVTYPSLAGTSVARDFVELPSQLYEHWLETDDVMQRFATHYKTGEPMPQALRDKLKAARNFNQGFATVEYLASALVDLAFHTDPAARSMPPLEFQAKVLKEIGLPNQIVMRHAAPHFLHVFAGEGYAAGYYSYMWSEVLDADAFTAFEETGDVYDPDLAARLKREIYAAGGRQKEADAYVAFRGKLPGVEGLLTKRGLADAAA